MQQSELVGGQLLTAKPLPKGKEWEPPAPIPDGRLRATAKALAKRRAGNKRAAKVRRAQRKQ